MNVKRTYLTVTVVKRGRSKNMCDQYSPYFLNLSKKATFPTKFGF